jgi:MFS superfamily sulfate permease-like transporter
MPFIAIIIGAHVAWTIKHRDHYNSPNYTHAYYAKSLSIVGIVKPGLDILRSPNLRHPWGQFFVDVIPLTLIAFMESYSVSRRIATQNNQLHILNASQELWANGVANLMGSISSAYPVSGSFSRSSLNQASGAKTPLSKATTLIIVIFALLVLTRTFQYIPQAALAAVIWSSIFNLINIGDFWEAWKHSKKDFLIMLITFAITFIFDTSIGLAVGIGFSLIVYLIETTFSGITAPLLVASSKDNHGIDVVKLEGDLTFLSAARVKDFLSVLTVKEPSAPDVTLGTSEYIHRTIGQAFDRALRPHLMDGVKELPKALVVDMAMVRLIDLTGIQALVEVIEDCRKKGILVVITYAHDDIQRALAKMGVENDSSTEEVNLDEYLAHKGAALLPVVAGGGSSHSNSLRISEHEHDSKDKAEGDEDEESKLSAVGVEPQRIDDRENIIVKSSDSATHTSSV